MKQKNFIGKLIAIDMYNCGTEEITSPVTAEELLRQGCDEFSLNCQQIICCQDDCQDEYSLFAICKQGHVTLHVYPKMGFMTVDIFSCFKEAEPAAFASYLRLAFDADKSKITLLDRGDFGCQNDMKPTRRSKIKFIRRTKNVTQNVSDRLKKMMMKPRSL
ncbi:S-adenosylmethionine decarboxylase family protein [uncultured Phascolarctobacterium sp.]|uniref:S-adenosylmethionine decarboxylase family protein n=1 Tax=uncultured Phascolarctobacterium sp. TaxID=512296 RepID=UPI002603C733|nr:S-adenosylmethionine decarboxylase [uncultured Phascolarctobacterium sp.]